MNSFLTSSLAATLILTAPLFAQDAPHRGTLVVCGGGRLPDTVVNRFVELAGGDNAKLVVIPTASSDATLPSEAEIRHTWKERGVGAVTILHTRRRELADSKAFCQPLNEATSVWISGGSQSRLAEAYVGTRVESELKALLSRGGVVGGTSAGAAIQSQVMIASGGDKPALRQGFDLAPRAIFDQHFLKRSRINRSMNAVRQHPNRVALGIDEGTALLIRGPRVEVAGSSYVLAISQNEGALRIRCFEHGDSFDLSKIAP